MADTNQDVSMRIQEKFEFYFLSLIFVLLGLAIQTASFYNMTYFKYFELVGWLSLIISGLAGLSRMEWLPPIHRAMHVKQKREKHLDDLLQVEERGGFPPMYTDKGGNPRILDEEIGESKALVERANAQINKIDKKNYHKYKIHKYGFVLGLIALCISRGEKPIMEILEKIF